MELGEIIKTISFENFSKTIVITNNSPVVKAKSSNKEIHFYRIDPDQVILLEKETEFIYNFSQMIIKFFLPNKDSLIGTVKLMEYEKSAYALFDSLIEQQNKLTQL